MSSQGGVKVVLIGAGSASFGRGAIADLGRTEGLGLPSTLNSTVIRGNSQ